MMHQSAGASISTTTPREQGKAVTAYGNEGPIYKVKRDINQKYELKTGVKPHQARRKAIQNNKLRHPRAVRHTRQIEEDERTTVEYSWYFGLIAVSISISSAIIPGVKHTMRGVGVLDPTMEM